MKLHILCDLHLEFEPFEPPDVGADVVILAGDTHIGDRGVSWAASAFGDTPVLYVMGNHEYYGKIYPKLLDRVRKAAEGTNVRVLEDEVAEIDGVRFFGSTLWTDFRLFGDPVLAGHACSEKVTDFKRIRMLPRYSKLRTADAAAIHARSKKALREASEEKQVDVVITHHAPSTKSLSEEFKDDLVSAAFVSDLDYLIERTGARLWIHGHTHAPFDYRIGETRVICNPRGYPDEPGTGFQADMIVEV